MLSPVASRHARSVPDETRRCHCPRHEEVVGGSDISGVRTSNLWSPTGADRKGEGSQRGQGINDASNSHASLQSHQGFQRAPAASTNIPSVAPVNTRRRQGTVPINLRIRSPPAVMFGTGGGRNIGPVRKILASDNTIPANTRMIAFLYDTKSYGRVVVEEIRAFKTAAQFNRDAVLKEVSAGHLAAV